MVDKLAWKHHLTTDEVEEVFQNKPRIQRIAKGHYQGEDVYAARGQTKAGRYLIVIFIYKKDHRALINTARDMTTTERRRYGKK
ncbi:BrnT family toxin [candidate division KSB1 bacterium]|nr:BrnT family toxin [candidate division KSB1 bacterium]